MTNKLLIANWKMNLSQPESLALIQKYAKLKKASEIELVACPCFTALESVGKAIKRSKIKLGAQNCSWELSGALTGEVSPAVLKELGCQYVILGHSERKEYLGEDFKMVNKKVLAALKVNLFPVICIGESWPERKNNKSAQVIKQQIKAVLSGVKIAKKNKLILAYEPFWAISTSRGRSARVEEVADSCQIIKRALGGLFSKSQVRDNFRIVYGGTVNQKTVATFLDIQEISGFLVGSVSLKIQNFKKLLEQL